MYLIQTSRAVWWLLYKDLLREFHAPRVGPGMLLLGVALAGTLEMQLNLPWDQDFSVVGGRFWLVVLLASTLALDRSISGEREGGCWQSLRLYPISPATILFAKTLVNFLALLCLECILVPVFFVFSEAPLAAQPIPFLVVLVLVNLGISSAGTLVSSLTSLLPHRGTLLVLLLLPLISPVVIGASEATRLLLEPEPGGDWRMWAQLLGVFDFVFLALGALVFEFVMEDGTS